MKRFVWTLALLLPAYATLALDGPFIGLSAGGAVDPGLPFQYGVTYQQFGGAGETITINLPSGFTFIGSDGGCTADGGRIVCPAASRLGGFNVTVNAPDILEGGTFIATATLSHAFTTSAPTQIARTFVVDSTNDDGSGSLRNAIETANARCTDNFPCKVAFRLRDATDTGYHTISLNGALPSITTSSLTIDGTTQTRTIGDTNPNGPEVYVDGSRVKSGDGFSFAACTSTVRGLAIGNFPDAGVRLQQADCAVPTQIVGNSVGVDPTGLHAAPNERGIVVDRRVATIAQNLISGNRRSGIFLTDRSPEALFRQQDHSRIVFNTIGIDRNHQPMANGACGVYVDGAATIEGNYIAFNREQGLSIAHYLDPVDVRTNSIFANGQMGIDLAIDGPSFSFRPAIVSARYDAASNRTQIDIVSITPPGTQFAVYRIYASDAPHPSGFGDGQYFLGSFFLTPNGQAFTFNALGDWRGKWVSATQTNVEFGTFDDHGRTSEFGRAVKVE
jgi:hypothetical protein